MDKKITKVLFKNKLLYPSDYISGVELQGRDVTLTIKSISITTLARQGTNQKENKPVLTFEKTAKKLVLNKTNAGTIADIYSLTKAEDFVGKKVTLFANSNGWVRIRDTRPKSEQAIPEEMANYAQQEPDILGDQDESVPANPPVPADMTAIDPADAQEPEQTSAPVPVQTPPPVQQPTQQKPEPVAGDDEDVNLAKEILRTADWSTSRDVLISFAANKGIEDAADRVDKHNKLFGHRADGITDAVKRLKLLDAIIAGKLAANGTITK